MSKPLSKRVGELFAHIQDLFDTAAHSAIQRVDEKGGKPWHASMSATQVRAMRSLGGSAAAAVGVAPFVARVLNSFGAECQPGRPSEKA